VERAIVTRSAAELAEGRNPLLPVRGGPLEGVLNQDQPRWYSELARQVEALPKTRIPADGLTAKEWKALFVEPESKRTVAIRDENNKPTGQTREVVSPEKSRLPGVKIEEIEWTGLNEWLDLQAEMATTAKEGHANFAKAAPVKVDRHYVIAAEGRILTEDGRYVNREKDGPTFPTKEAAQAAIDAKVKAGAPAGKVTRQQISEYLANNGVKVDEVMKGGRKYDNSEEGMESLINDASSMRPLFEEIRFEDENGLPVQFDDFKSADERIEFMIKEQSQAMEYIVQNGAEEVTKFGSSSLQLPGAKPGSYRELLLTLPTKSSDDKAAAILAAAGLKLDIRGANQYAVDATTGQRVNPGDADPDLRGADGREATPEETAAIRAARSARGDDPKFTRSHWDEPNVLAHVRFNERTDADGKRVLFVEEIQSDWAQKGKKEGFQRNWPKEEDRKSVV
jgi:hypothetical protein